MAYPDPAGMPGQPAIQREEVHALSSLLGSLLSLLQQFQPAATPQITGLPQPWPDLGRTRNFPVSSLTGRRQSPLPKILPPILCAGWRPIARAKGRPPGSRPVSTARPRPRSALPIATITGACSWCGRPIGRSPQLRPPIPICRHSVNRPPARPPAAPPRNSTDGDRP